MEKIDAFVFGNGAASATVDLKPGGYQSGMLQRREKFHPRLVRSAIDQTK